MTHPQDDIDSRMARHVAKTSYEDIPPPALQAARRSLLDSVGVMLAAAHETGPATPFLKLVTRDGGEAEASLLAGGAKAPAAAAAFANGALSHALDFGDGHAETFVHPHGAVIPVALAVTEARGATGKDLLTAIVIGYDISIRLSRALGTAGSGTYYHPALAGSLAAASTAASLMRLSAAQVRDAWSFALFGAGAPGAMSRSRGGALRCVRDAFGARSGVEAARLAAEGLPGVDQPLTGQGGFLAMYGATTGSAASMLNNLGTRFEGVNVAYKVFPSCGGTHALVQAALEMRAEGLEPEAVKKIEARVPALFFDSLCQPIDQKRRPPAPLAAKFSIPYCVAAALRDGNLRLGRFDSGSFNDPRILQLAEKLACTLDETLGPLEGELIVETECGARFRRKAGGDGPPVTQAKLIEKFEDCLAHADPPICGAAARRLANALLTIDREVAAGAFIGRVARREFN